MSSRYSAFALVRQGFAGHKGWPHAWRKAKPKPAYDFVIIGGGGHGLATAYYLAKIHRRPRVCMIEKSWLGGGNTGRNTAIVRSNYFYPESVALYDLALRVYEGLSRELDRLGVDIVENCEVLDSGAKRNAVKRSGFERLFQARQVRLGMAS